MKVDTYFAPPIKKAAKVAQELEGVGFDGAWIAETGHNPFFPLIPAATHTHRLQLATGIAVALARSPMTLAQEAWDLAEVSGGRFILGLGSQVKAHITRRFSMPWDKPVEQMRDMVGALRAIWTAFAQRTPLKHEGPYYKLSLITPFFAPEPMPHADIPIYLSAVGPKMTELAGEVANGALLHAFSNEAYLKQVTLPAVEAGLKKAGRERSSFTLAGPVFVITGNEEQAARMEKMVREQIAFYGSTPAYEQVLGVLGEGDLHKELHRLSRAQQWDEMARLIPDHVLEACAVRAPLATLGDRLRERYGPYYDRVVMYLPLPNSDMAAVQACLAAARSSPVS